MKWWMGVLIFVLGLAAGISGMRLIPSSVSPYLPTAFQGQNEIVKGVVVRKHEEKERLLLTVSTPRGALLATFTRQIPEINLLVEDGDEVTLGLAHYAPFVHDPVIKGVMKPDHFGDGSREISPPIPETPRLPESIPEPLSSDSDSADSKI